MRPDSVHIESFDRAEVLVAGATVIGESHVSLAFRSERAIVKKLRRAYPLVSLRYFRRLGAWAGLPALVVRSSGGHAGAPAPDAPLAQSSGS